MMDCSNSHDHGLEGFWPENLVDIIFKKKGFSNICSTFSSVILKMLLIRVQCLYLCSIANRVSAIGFKHVAAKALCLWNTHATRAAWRALSTLYKHANTAVCFLIEELFVRKTSCSVITGHW